MQKHLFDHVDIAPWNTHVLDGMATNPVAECTAFEQRIAAVGGVDCWLLGIGVNGHIAFNEPGSDVATRTRIVGLTPATIAENSRFFNDSTAIPRCALSVGIGTIRDARQVVLLATGAKKADAVAAAVQGPFSTKYVAFSQQHPDYIVVVLQVSYKTTLT